MSKFLAPLLALALSGCATSFSPAQLAQRLNAKAPDVPALTDAVGALSTPAESVISAPKPAPRALASQRSDPLPDIQLGAPLALYGATVDEALSLALAGTGVRYTVLPGTMLLPALKGQSSGLAGSLSQVVDDLSRQYGFFWTYRSNGTGGSLMVEPDREFVVDIPPIAELTRSVAKVLAERGAQRISVDSATGLVSYRANRIAADSIGQYLEQALSQKLLVYEVSILEVRLASGQKTGVDWTKLRFDRNAADSLSLSSNNPAISGAANLATAWTFGTRFSLDVLLSFLSTQGTVSVVSQPRVAILSGGETEIRVGNTIRYVKQVGTSQVGNTAAAQTTADVAELNTGIQMKVGGRYWQDSVVTTVELKLSELLGIEKLAINRDTVLQLPATSDRDLGKNILRLRPGEAGLLFGVITERSSDTRQGFSNAPGLDLFTTTRRDDNRERNELIVVLRPRVMSFVNEGQGAAQ